MSNAEYVFFDLFYKEQIEIPLINFLWDCEIIHHDLKISKLTTDIKRAIKYFLLKSILNHIHQPRCYLIPQPQIFSKGDWETFHYFERNLIEKLFTQTLLKEFPTSLPQIFIPTFQISHTDIFLPSSKLGGKKLEEKLLIEEKVNSFDPYKKNSKKLKAILIRYGLSEFLNKNEKNPLWISSLWKPKN